jgi:segregation and condensation protein A
MTWCSSWQASLAVAEDASVDAGEATPSGLLLQLDGFEGPLDLLLDLARGQKVDLARISILSLVEQYLAVIEGARRVRLELAADWLVMAAWLTWLKSRLLLPAGSGAAEEGEAAAETLAARLLALQTTRAVARWLGARPQLGHDVFARGAGENFTETDRSRLALDVNGLLRAYLMALRRGTVHRHYRPAPMTLWSVQDALARLSAMLGSLPDWATLDLFLPASLAGPLERRAAVASTLLASLEMARGGAIRLRQSAAFAPIMMRAGSGLPADDEEVPDAALEGDNV